jgi:probable F420-dependent oxidoreductase
MSLALGFGLPCSGSWATPDNVLTFARRAEDLGYSSLWTFQRVLTDTERDWAPQYRSVLDPIVVLGYAAAVTSRARLGTAIVNAPFLPPPILAKQYATLDILSSGRLDVGLGLGWVEEEFTAVGVPYARRGARLEEVIACLRAVWADDPVEFGGEFYQVPRSAVLPKPVQRPGPPLLLGGYVEAALQRVGRLADGWISASRQDLTKIGPAIETVRSSAAEAGRDPASLRFIVRGVVLLGDRADDDSGNRRPLTGSDDEIRGDLQHLEEQGVTDVFVDLNFNPRVGNPDADPAAAREFADEVLETFAPASANSQRQR